MKFVIEGLLITGNNRNIKKQLDPTGSEIKTFLKLFAIEWRTVGTVI